MIRATNLEVRGLNNIKIQNWVGLALYFGQFLNIVLQQTIWFDAENLRSSFNPIFELPGAEEPWRGLSVCDYTYLTKNEVCPGRFSFP